MDRVGWSNQGLVGWIVCSMLTISLLCHYTKECHPKHLRLTIEQENVSFPRIFNDRTPTMVKNCFRLKRTASSYKGGWVAHQQERTQASVLFCDLSVTQRSLIENTNLGRRICAFAPPINSPLATKTTLTVNKFTAVSSTAFGDTLS